MNKVRARAKRSPVNLRGEENERKDIISPSLHYVYPTRGRKGDQIEGKLQIEERRADGGNPIEKGNGRSGRR